MSSCIADTNSIDLTVGSGVLSADAKISANPANALSILASGLFATLDWISIAATLSYFSAAAPVYVVTTSVDYTGVLAPGTRIKFTQSATVKYFEIVAITATQLTLYGGDQYSVANGPAITAVSISRIKNPLGFPALTCATALPTVAYDGMEVDFLASTAIGAVWKFRYRSASASTYKWECYGAQPLAVGFATLGETPGTGFGDFGTPLNITVPLAGEFWPSVEIVTLDPGSTTLTIDLSVNAALTTRVLTALSGYGIRGHSKRYALQTLATAGQVVKLQRKDSAGTTAWTFQDGNLQVTPVRCA